IKAARPLGRAAMDPIGLSVDVVYHPAIPWIDEVDASVGVVVPVLAHRWAPLRRDSAEFHISGNSAADSYSLPNCRTGNSLFHHVLLDTSALLRSNLYR